jgi:hypothetical protein
MLAQLAPLRRARLAALHVIWHIRWQCMFVTTLVALRCEQGFALRNLDSALLPIVADSFSTLHTELVHLFPSCSLAAAAN